MFISSQNFPKLDTKLDSAVIHGAHDGDVKVAEKWLLSNRPDLLENALWKLGIKARGDLSRQFDMLFQARDHAREAAGAHRRMIEATTDSQQKSQLKELDSLLNKVGETVTTLVGKGRSIESAWGFVLNALSTFIPRTMLEAYRSKERDFRGRESMMINWNRDSGTHDGRTRIGSRSLAEAI